MVMNMKRFFYILIAAGLAFASCARTEIEPQDQHGYLTVGISRDVSADVQVKSSSEEEEIVYRLEVIDSKGNVDYSADDHRTVTDPIELLMDKYTVTAANGEPLTCFNGAYWYGENSVRVYAESQASVSIACKMRKVKFSVHFPEDEEFKTMFRNYELEVKAGEDVLTFSSDAGKIDHIAVGDFTDTAYFAVPSDKVLTYTLKMQNAQNRFYYTTNKIEKVNEAEHYHFDFKMGEREEIDGALVLNVTLNGEYSDVHSHELLLNFDRFEMPSYGHNAEFDPDAEGIVYPLHNAIPKKLTFAAPRKIKSLVISHLDENLLAEGLPQVLEFMNITPERAQIAAGLGITYSEITSESVSAEIDITEFVKNLPISPENTSYLMSFTVVDAHDRYARCDFEFTIVSDIQAETMSAFTWSGFSILKGRYFSRTAPEGITFQYKEKSASDWIEIAPGLIDVDPNTLTFSYRLNHLNLNTEYVFRATSDKDKADGKTAAEIEFTTYASENVLKNMNLDSWYADGAAWFPNASSSSADWVWDTANGGTKALSVYPTNPESEIVAVSGEGKKAAKMVSQYAKIKFAAGNIYTGKFVDVDLANAGAELDWGLPFDSRPLALRGWIRYEPATVTEHIGAGYEFMKDKPDIGQVQIFLTDWTEPFRIKANSSSPRFVDFTGDYILAHGEFLTDQNTTQMEGNVNGYIQFVIPLEYRTLKQPNYIVISGAASRYGDYFTGGDGSTMYLDELELIYDPDELTDEQFEQVISRVY